MMVNEDKTQWQAELQSGSINYATLQSSATIDPLHYGGSIVAER
jgi:hypothetical protein